MDRQTARRLDNYITREPPEPPEPPVCDECGEELPDEPVQRIEQHVFDHCDGAPSIIECEHEEGVLAIIGEEFRDKTFKVAYAPACGTKDGSGYGEQTEINVDEAPEWTHDPHFYEEPMGFSTTYVRRCPNGHTNKETVV